MTAEQHQPETDDRADDRGQQDDQGLVLLRRQGRDIPMAFGPYLAAAGWIALIWGHEITAAYLDNSGIH